MGNCLRNELLRSNDVLNVLVIDAVASINRG